MTFDPKELIKCKKQVLNPFVGYRSVTDSNEKFGTESTGLWHDRQLFDSMIFREIKRARVQRKSRKEMMEEEAAKSTTATEATEDKSETKVDEKK